MLYWEVWMISVLPSECLKFQSTTKYVFSEKIRVAWENVWDTCHLPNWRSWPPTALMINSFPMKSRKLPKPLIFLKLTFDTYLKRNSNQLPFRTAKNLKKKHQPSLETKSKNGKPGINPEAPVTPKWRNFNLHSSNLSF